jgi:hypothetical protein
VNSAKNYLILFLALTTAAGAALAWKQYQELSTLRAAALASTERSDQQKRVSAAEKSRDDLAARAAASAKTTAAAAAEVMPEPAPERAWNGGGRREAFISMMEKPEVQRLMAIQQKAALDNRYASLFKSLNLSPEQLAKFKDLLVEKSTAMMDVMAAARSQGVNPRSDPAAYRTLVANAQGEIDQNIRSTLGETAFNQYQDYEHTAPQRAVVSQLEQRLSYSSTPLTPEQSAQMVQLLAATTTAPRQGGNGFFVGAPGTGPGGGGVNVTDATMNQALGVLAAPQLDALRQIQQEQQAQAALAAEFRNQARANRGAPAGAVTTRPGG